MQHLKNGNTPKASLYAPFYTERTPNTDFLGHNPSVDRQCCTLHAHVPLLEFTGMDVRHFNRITDIQFPTKTDVFLFQCSQHNKYWVYIISCVPLASHSPAGLNMNTHNPKYMGGLVNVHHADKKINKADLRVIYLLLCSVFCRSDWLSVQLGKTITFSCLSYDLAAVRQKYTQGWSSHPTYHVKRIVQHFGIYTYLLFFGLTWQHRYHSHVSALHKDIKPRGG